MLLHLYQDRQGPRAIGLPVRLTNIRHPEHTRKQDRRARGQPGLLFFYVNHCRLRPEIRPAVTDAPARPILGISIEVEKEEELDGTIWITTHFTAEDGNNVAFFFLSDLCNYFSWDLNEVTLLLARTLVEQAGKDS